MLRKGVKRKAPTGELEPHLRVGTVLQYGDGKGLAACQAMALLDTGAEVCLVRKGLIPESAFRDATSPLRLIAANNQVVEGGDREVEVDIRFVGVESGTEEKRMLLMPTILMEANIDEDFILSYLWMGERDVRVAP